jgi:hypothetical protein
MGVTRRRFIACAVAFLASIAGPPRKWACALRARIYPGPVVALDAEQVRQPGKWAG